MEEVWRLASSHPEIRDSNMKSIGFEENKNDGLTDNEYDDEEEEEDQTENIISADDVEMKIDGTLNILEGGTGMGSERVNENPRDKVLLFIKLFQVDERERVPHLSIVSQILVQKDLTISEARFVI
jgi:hypothetical protein